MNKLRWILGLGWCLGGLGLAGCETVVDVDTPPHKPRLALSYTLSNTPPEVSTDSNYRPFFAGRSLFVSSSQGVLETKELNGRGDATVELLDERGQVVEQFRSKPEEYRYNYNGVEGVEIKYGKYEAVRGFTGAPGRSYTLRAAAPGVETLEATLTLPEVPSIESAEYVAKPRDPNSGNYGYGYGYAGRLTLVVADNPATTDYYLASARVLDKQGLFWGTVLSDYNSNGIDGPEINLSRFQLSEPGSNYRQFPYSDATSNGQRLSFSTDVRLNFQGSYNSNNIPEPGYVEVFVSSITPDTYRFHQSVLRYYDTDGNIFAEPAPLYSNFRGGFGLFGGATDATYRIKLF